MDSNSSEPYTTLEQFANILNLTFSNLTNESAVSPEELFDLYEAYRTREKEQVLVYKSVAYVLGTLIILSNLTVVVSSGLILRKGQQPKSTYLLLGNVSLADTIVGISIIFGTVVDNSTSSNPLCIFQLGMIVCPTMVSIFSVGLIAVDRYIYILHGLYYQQWFNTTRVRIGILIIWLVGLILGLMPVTGWTNKELQFSRCHYISLFPYNLILFNALLSMLPIILVAILYSFILVSALKSAGDINAAKQHNINSNDETNKSILRIYRGNQNAKRHDHHTICVRTRKMDKMNELKRSSSEAHIDRMIDKKTVPIKMISASSLNKIAQLKNNNNNLDSVDSQQSVTQKGSELSIWTVASSINQVSTDSVKPVCKYSCNVIKQIKKRKATKEPCKFRAIVIVMLTSGSFIVTWVPFFITVVFFVFCDNKLTNHKCIDMKALLGGPLAILAFLNSLLNPLIYAWWHKGFKNAVKYYFYKYYCSNKNLSNIKHSR